MAQTLWRTFASATAPKIRPADNEERVSLVSQKASIRLHADDLNVFRQIRQAYSGSRITRIELPDLCGKFLSAVTRWAKFSIIVMTWPSGPDFHRTTPCWPLVLMASAAYSRKSIPEDVTTLSEKGEVLSISVFTKPRLAYRKPSL